VDIWFSNVENFRVDFELEYSTFPKNNPTT